ncbi:MAG: class 3 adenylate cyclase [Kiritimatiellia bacterium]|jgi:class 3 adenylate cyclase
MFCDLVGSTELSQRLDPEDLREINRAYQDTCKAAIERYEGYVARYMGDARSPTSDTHRHTRMIPKEQSMRGSLLSI